MKLIDRVRAFLRPLRAVETAAMLSNPFSRGETMPTYNAGLLGFYSSPDAAMQSSALAACVRLISGNVAKLPCPVYRRRGEERQRDRNHWADRLLNEAPNQWQTAFEFRRMMTASVALSGNAYALKRMSGAAVEELIPWPSSRVRVKQEDPFSPPTYELEAAKGGSYKPYPASDILHLRDLTLDGVTGLSRIDQLRQGLLLTMAAETYATAYFLNGAEGGVTLTTDKGLTDAQRKAISESWKAAHQGPGKAHLPAVLEGGLKKDQPTSSNKDSQFLELRSFQVEDIARAYGVPPHLIGLTEKQTSWGTGVEQMAIGFLEFNLTDWLKMWETAVKRDLLGEPSDRDVFVEHLIDALQRADIKTRTEVLVAEVNNSILSPNEARQKLNLPGYPGGEKFRYPSNETVVGDPAALKPAPPLAFPSDDPRHAWRTGIRSAQRAVASRKAS